MTENRDSPIRPTDDQARALARQLVADARFGALGVIEPKTGAPMVTRIGLAQDGQGVPVTLISSLSAHTEALRACPTCSVLIGEPGIKGDPLTHPRLTLQCTARFVARTGPEHATLRATYLRQQPKAKLYIDFGDFSLVRLDPLRAYLNAGFGRAFHLSATDIAAPEPGAPKDA